MVSWVRFKHMLNIVWMDPRCWCDLKGRLCEVGFLSAQLQWKQGYGIRVGNQASCRLLIMKWDGCRHSRIPNSLCEGAGFSTPCLCVLYVWCRCLRGADELGRRLAAKQVLQIYGHSLDCYICWHARTYPYQDEVLRRHINKLSVNLDM